MIMVGTGLLWTEQILNAQVGDNPANHMGLRCLPLKPAQKLSPNYRTGGGGPGVGHYCVASRAIGFRSCPETNN